jgi:signal transduction histidine kinase
VAAWMLLLTFGVSGLLSFLHSGPHYLKNYFQTSEFEYQLDDFVRQLSIYELNNLTKEEVKSLIFVTNDEIEEHRYRYGNLNEQITNIKDQYDVQIEEALANENQTVADAYIAERDKKIEDISKNFSSDDYVREKIRKEKEQIVDEYYRTLENNRSEFLKMKESFRYYLRDVETGDIYTNVTLKSDEMNNVFNKNEMHFIRNYPSSIEGYLSTEQRGSYFGYDDTLIAPIEENAFREFEGKIAVPKSLQATTSLRVNYESYQQRKVVLIAQASVGLLALLLAYFINKRSPILNRVNLTSLQRFYDRIPLDLRIILFVFFAFAAFFILVRARYVPYDITSALMSYLIDFFLHLSITTLFVSIALIQAMFLWRLLNNPMQLQPLWEGTVLYRCKRALQDAFLNRRTGTQLMILLFIVFGFGLGFSVVFIEPVLIIPYGLVFLVIGFPVLFILLKRIGYFNRISENASEIAQGRFVQDLPIKGKSVLATLASDINTLKHGVKASQKEQAKSERLKTELITNVSHDLRTPLTSIITYTELLKSEGLTDVDRDAFIQVIDRKSKRLKVLIDDLFEASKMASGNIELIKEKVDLVQLLQQALGEYNEAMDESSLQFRVTTPDTPIYARVDGQKMWRVFDNLIGNILRYSLEQTRVYISLKVENNEARITFKNVTKYELGDGVDELIERFKRGDASRHTEGSGLGLAIAKSIVDLHGGRFDIEIDGDLFKVIVALEVN